MFIYNVNVSSKKVIRFVIFYSLDSQIRFRQPSLGPVHDVYIRAMLLLSLIKNCSILVSQKKIEAYENGNAVL